MRTVYSIKNKILVILASVIGNVVEFFDLTIYVVLLPKFAWKFFPFDTAFSSLLISLVVFAVAFFARPFGAILFGFIGDRYGRRIALIYSILLMSGATFLIGLLPTYESIGMAAPFFLIVLRLIQGLSMGGEFTSSSIFLIEYLDKKEGLAAGITISSIVFGAILATYIGHLVIFENLPDYAWRFPFLLGGLLAGIGVCFRIIVEETPEYKKIVIKKQTSKAPLKELYNSYLYEVFLVIGICSYGGAISYTLMAFAPLHFSSILNFDLDKALSINYYGLFAFSLSSISFGVLSDKIGAGRMLLLSSFIGSIAGLPIFYYIETDNQWCLIALEIFLGLLAGSYCGAQLVFISKFFPTRIRCTAVCFGYSIGTAILGGTFPFIAFLLIDKFKVSFIPGFYLSICGCVGFIFVILGIRWQNKIGCDFLLISKKLL